MGKIRQRKLSRVFKTAISLELKNVETCGRPTALQYGVILHYSKSILLYVCGVVSDFAKFTTIFVVNNSLGRYNFIYSQ